MRLRPRRRETAARPLDVPRDPAALLPAGVRVEGYLVLWPDPCAPPPTRPLLPLPLLALPSSALPEPAVSPGHRQETGWPLLGEGRWTVSEGRYTFARLDPVEEGAFPPTILWAEAVGDVLYVAAHSPWVGVITQQEAACLPRAGAVFEALAAVRLVHVTDRAELSRVVRDHGWPDPYREDPASPTPRRS
ncbi:hypothetical protein [Carbonactinospora thermoautotrophica]|nr:hypothetical protein [Carbonactinospora thermoautotrophica]